MKKFYNKVVGFVGSIPADKALHFIAGLIIAAITAICIPIISSFAFVLSFFIGLVKEVFDLFVTDNFSDKDLLATSLGGIIMQVFIWLLL